MKKNLMILGLLILSAYDCFGQYELALSRRDSIWIQNRGFPLQAYDGSSPAVNEQLMFAAKYRKQSVRCIAVGLPVWFGGSVLGMVGFTQLIAYAVMAPLYPHEHKGINTALLASAPVTLAGFSLTMGRGPWKKAQARIKVDEARKLYYSL